MKNKYSIIQHKNSTWCTVMKNGVFFAMCDFETAEEEIKKDKQC